MSSGRLPSIVRTTSFRLASAYSLIFAASLGLLGTLVYWTTQAALDRHIATRIDSEMAFLVAKYRMEGLAELVEEVHERMESFVGGSHFEYLVVNGNGERLAGNLPAMPDKAGWSDVKYQADARNPNGIRVRVRVDDLDAGVRFAVGDDLSIIREINTSIAGAFGWLLLAFVPVSLVGGLILSRRFLRQVDAITRTAEAIIGGDLTQRIPPRGTNDDLDRLSNTLNRMLDRIATLIESLRQVSNDIAHELRTPLTRLRNKLVAAQSPIKSNQDQHHDAIESMIAETDGILDTFSALLRIAQIEAGTRRAGFETVDLSDTFENVTHAFEAAAEAEGKTIVSNVQPGHRIRGDRELLTQMLANLLDNAIQHTPSGSRIEMTLIRDTRGLIGSVADDGPGVPAEDRERIFERFYRIERSRATPGSGLGLAVVAAIAELHEIKVNACDRSPGLEILLQFDQHQLRSGSN